MHKDRMNKKLKGAIISKYGSQIDFALAHSIDDTYVSKIVMGHRQLVPEKQKQWANWLDCRVEDIFSK
jgi:hypothetical protein